MKDVAVVGIIIGVLLIAGRGPFIIAPEAARKFYLKLFSTNNRIRILGLIPFFLSVAMIVSARGEEQIFAQVILWFGYFMAIVSIFGCLIFPFIVQRIVQFMLEELNGFILRGIGVLSVMLGIFLIYLSFTVLN